MTLTSPSPRRSWWLTLCALLTLLISATGCEAGGITLSFDRETLQKRVEQNFPLKRDLNTATVTMTDPVLDFDAGPGRIGLTTDIAVGRKGGLLALNGTARASGSVRYDVETATLYMTDPKIEDLELPMKLMGETRRQKLLDTVNLSIADAIGDIPLHTLDNIPRNRAAKALIKDVTVKDRRLVVVIGFGGDKKP